MVFSTEYSQVNDAILVGELFTRERERERETETERRGLVITH